MTQNFAFLKFLLLLSIWTCGDVRHFTSPASLPFLFCLIDIDGEIPRIFADLLSKVGVCTDSSSSATSFCYVLFPIDACWQYHIFLFAFEYQQQAHQELQYHFFLLPKKSKFVPCAAHPTDNHTVDELTNLSITIQGTCTHIYSIKVWHGTKNLMNMKVTRTQNKYPSVRVWWKQVYVWGVLTQPRLTWLHLNRDRFGNSARLARRITPRTPNLTNRIQWKPTFTTIVFYPLIDIVFPFFSCSLRKRCRRPFGVSELHSVIFRQAFATHLLHIATNLIVACCTIAWRHNGEYAQCNSYL